METTTKEYIDQKQSELFKQLGCFFAFNKQQWEEGLAAAGGIEKTGKYVNVGHGLLCPTKNMVELLQGMEKIKSDWNQERQKVEQVQLKFVGIDNWNRPVWKAPDQKAYYGSVHTLFNFEDTEQQVREKITDVYDLCYFGDHMGCEPMGSDVPDRYFI